VKLHVHYRALTSSTSPPVTLATGIDSHTGKFVSESKFRSDPATFIPLIRARDRRALEGLITKPAVERALLARLRAKAAQYAVDFNGAGEPVPQTGTAPPPSPGAQAPTTALGKGDVVNVINELYELHIIPLTKEVEVRRLLFAREALLTPAYTGGLSPSALGRTLRRGSHTLNVADHLATRPVEAPKYTPLSIHVPANATPDSLFFPGFCPCALRLLRQAQHHHQPPRCARRRSACAYAALFSAAAHRALSA
jgi:hypothetical protein